MPGRWVLWLISGERVWLIGGQGVWLIAGEECGWGGVLVGGCRGALFVGGDGCGLWVDRDVVGRQLGM